MRILLVGGGGFFGRQILEVLAADPRHVVTVAGRRPLPVSLPCAFVPLDITAPDLSRRLQEMAPELVIHCAGPFRPDEYGLAEAALGCGRHYLDLADDRRYVTGIGRFDAEARRRGVVMQSGVSSVPALSSAVVAAHQGEFSRLECIDIGISVSERVPGIGVVRSVLDQAGRPLPDMPGSSGGAAWTERWRVELPAPVGNRVVSRCDVPDLALFPAHIAGLRRVTFRGGLASPWLMRGLRLFARMRRRGWIRHPAAWAGPMTAAARWLCPFGSGASGMFVRLAGQACGAPRVLWWRLVATANQGVRVPAQGVIAMAERLTRRAVASGARPCFMELTLDEYLRGLPVTTRVDRLSGEAARLEERQWQSV